MDAAVIMVDRAANRHGGRQCWQRRRGHPRSDLGVPRKAWGVTLSEDAVADAAKNAIALCRLIPGNQARMGRLAHPLFIGPPASDMTENDLGDRRT